MNSSEVLLFKQCVETVIYHFCIHHKKANFVCKFIESRQNGCKRAKLPYAVVDAIYTILTRISAYKKEFRSSLPVKTKQSGKLHINFK